MHPTFSRSSVASLPRRLLLKPEGGPGSARGADYQSAAKNSLSGTAQSLELSYRHQPPLARAFAQLSRKPTVRLKIMRFRALSRSGQK